MGCSIIVPTLKSYEELTDLRKELSENTTGAYKIIYTCKKVSAAENRNIGLDEAKFENIIMVDDDIKDFPYGWNEELVRVLDEEPNVVLVSARLMNTKGEIGLNMGGNYNLKGSIVEVESGYVPTACICFKKNTLRYDEAYVGSGFEDTDMCNQMMQLYPEGRHVIANTVKVTHINEMKNQQGANWEKNKAYYQTKWEGFSGRKMAVTDKKLTLCMIVKNEEKNLVRCLESCKGIFDEIIIVDTGSTDKTIDIAESYGSKILHFEWCNDFAAARNFGIEQASGDWIFVLDADEELVGTRNDLIELANVPTSRPVSYMVKILNIMDGGNQVEHHMARFFPRADGTIKYDGSIHESVKSTRDGELLSVICNKVKIKHYGYGSQILTDRNKTTRNIDALLAEIEKNPDNAFFRYHIGITYRISGNNEEAEKHFIKWDEIVSKLNENIDLSMGYAAYIGVLLSLNKFQDAKEIGEKVARRCSHNPDFCLNFAIILEHLGQLDLALTYTEKALSAKSNPFPSLSYDRDTMGWKALAVKGNIFAQKGDHASAIQCWEDCLKDVPENKDVLRALVTVHMTMGNLLKAEGYMETLLRIYPDEQSEQAKVMMGNLKSSLGKLDEALEIFWSCENRKTYIDQMLTGYISYQDFAKVKKIEEFTQRKSKEEVNV